MKLNQSKNRVNTGDNMLKNANLRSFQVNKGKQFRGNFDYMIFDKILYSFDLKYTIFMGQ